LAIAADTVEIYLRRFDLEVIRLRDVRARDVKQVDDAVALTAFKMGVEGGISVKADFRVLYFYGLDELLCKQQLQRIVNGCARKGWIFRRKSVENRVNRWMDVVVAKKMKDGDTRAGR
jgi:hypothetical protein